MIFLNQKILLYLCFLKVCILGRPAQGLAVAHEIIFFCRRTSIQKFALLLVRRPLVGIATAQSEPKLGVISSH